MKNSPSIKICFGASSGGHSSQLFKLLEFQNDWSVKPSLFISTLEQYRATLEKRGSTYIIGECNREHLIKLLAVLFRTFFIVAKERPDVIITTGALPMAAFCFWGKLFGAKIVWIDSIANVNSLSMSGAFVRHFADLFIVQWPELASKYSGVEFVGALA
ncbi:MAG: hypothetical protein GKR93_08565 [Gammaproteobacteria bacterium]|nr:hypothetical protein [Gammaproteobacteria bacterium]